MIIKEKLLGYVYSKTTTQKELAKPRDKTYRNIKN